MSGFELAVIGGLALCVGCLWDIRKLMQKQNNLLYDLWMRHGKPPPDEF